MAFQFLNCCICCLYYRNSQFKTIHILQTQLVLSQERARALTHARTHARTHAHTHTHTHTHTHIHAHTFSSSPLSLSLSGTDTHACTRSVTHAHTVYTRHVSVSLWSSFSNTPKGWRLYLQGQATPFKPWTCTFLYIHNYRSLVQRAAGGRCP